MEGVILQKGAGNYLTMKTLFLPRLHLLTHERPMFQCRRRALAAVSGLA